MNQDNVFIDSVGNLKENLAVNHQIIGDSNLIREVMRKDLRMRYKLVTPISWTENSVKSKILRQ